MKVTGAVLISWLTIVSFLSAAEPRQLRQEPNTWVKRSPLPGGPVSPRLGYEGALGYDPVAQRLIRWGGHNQGGGGEQNAETWIFDLHTGRWELQEPNRSPPGVCCAQQNVFDLAGNRFLRFPAFSGSHGWHWFRENYLTNSTVWSYDLAANTWRDMRPTPAPRVRPLRCASWDSTHQVVVLFGGEGSHEGTLVYDPYTNTWTRMHPKVQPAPRSGGNMTYDAARQLHILFGAQFSDDPHTWAYDLRQNEWRDMKPPRQPATNRNDAVLAYDPNHEIVIAVIRVIDQGEKNEIVRAHLETWSYDAGENIWTNLNPKEGPIGWGSRSRVLVAAPDQNVVVLENVISPARIPGAEREQQVWTYRYAEAKPTDRPAPPHDVRVSASQRAATLTWKHSHADQLREYIVYRGQGAKPWLVDYQEIARVPLEKTSYRDDDLHQGELYYYFLRAIDTKGQISDASLKVRTQPPLVEDLVVSVLSPREVQLTWKAPPEADGSAYLIERAPVEVFTEDEILRLKKDTPPLSAPSVGTIKAIGVFERITKEPIKGLTYTDKTVDLNQPAKVNGEPIQAHYFRDDQLDPKGTPYRHAVYAYRVRHINPLGVAGGDAPYVLTIPSAPQFLFSKEDGDQCHLKWQANPEQKLLGYRVYRMDSPRINGPGQPVRRLTAEPISETSFTDTQAGKNTMRYWVVAVDALGQEGTPSAPTWHYREYRRFYEPFVGEWHQ
ncbi:MAG: hypothetical protein ACK4RK_12075 [Gemmataceae bacterium]